MHLFTALTALLLASPAICARTSQNPPGKNAILLSNVDALTLRANRMTTSRRVSPIPQLTCTGPSKICAMYQIETMRCKNEGYDYDAEDVQWTCVASLPAEFKLGSTDVVCEGYRNSDDKWVLKGSCGVEYRMLLTELGEEKYGKQINSGTGITGWFETIFFFGFIAVVFLIIFAAATGIGGNRRQEVRRGWGGFWGGGGGGGGGGYPPGPPPPYSRFSDSRFSDSNYSDSKSWKPGFWTGALSGAAAGYGMGRRSGNWGRSNNYDNGEGSSRSARSPGFSSPTSSTGFGSTRRR